MTRRFVISALTVLAAAMAAPASPAAPVFKAGAHAQDISPTHFPSPVNGGMKGGFAKGITDPIHARCLALQDGSKAMILAVVDACMIPLDICDKAKAAASAKTGVPVERMLISATHTHSSATMTPVFQSDPDPAYLATLPDRIALGLITAYQNLEPAEAGWAVGEDATQVFNRRWLVKEGESYENPFDGKADRAWMNPGVGNAKVSGPTGPVDPQVAVFAVRSAADHRPIAVLANYSLHYVGGNPPISADYFAAFANELAHQLETGDHRYQNKPPFVGIMSNGTSGNINNLNFGATVPAGRLRAGQRIQEVAASVAGAAMKAYGAVPWKKDLTLDSREEVLHLDVRKASGEELVRARNLLNSVPKDKDGQWADRKAIYAREALLLDAYPDKVPVKLQAHRIGDLAITSIPCEVFVEIGLDLKKTNPFKGSFTISLANGYNGYLPTTEHHAMGGYETWRARSSYLEVPAADKISTSLKAMLASLKKDAS
ncbi:hypothetical protein [Verrucomicrobium spinosum]|uniref:hypothetical protein n=1 Tax=Verrucomicrobium spinosum TaxID=2736 RepID=UPI0001746939|nr:hypothetical protein [Verrucomicrobium spinosum]